MTKILIFFILALAVALVKSNFLVTLSQSHTKMADIFTSKEVDTQEKIRKTKRLATFMVRSAVYHPINPENPDQVRNTILYLLESKRGLENPQAIFIKPLGRKYEPDSCLKNDQERPFATTLFTESQKESSPGDLTIVVPGKQYTWGRLTNVVVDEEKKQGLLNVARWSYSAGSRYYLKETRIYSRFSERARIVPDGIRTTRQLGGRNCRLRSSLLLLSGGRGPKRYWKN